MKLPRLYKKTKTGSVQICDISVANDTFTVTWGQLGGKLQKKITKCDRRNIGKKNETTAKEQAESEALSKHTKKIKAGYVLDESGGLVVKLPQKVKAYVGNESKIIFPAYSTPKLNGVNATYWLVGDELKLTSRGGDEYPAIPHLEDEVRKVMKYLDTDCLNGELYIYGEHLQDITSAVKKPKELSKLLEFHIFELPNYEGTYAAKRIKLDSILALNLTKVAAVSSSKVTSAEGIERHYNRCMSAGLEGTVIYNADAPYEFNTRSSHVYKYKKTQDAEFQILNYEVDKNGHPVLICNAKGDKPFKVKPKGTDAERKQIIEDFDEKYKMAWYKIEYEMLSKDGIPLKGVGIGLRACDSDGAPLE